MDTIPRYTARLPFDEIIKVLEKSSKVCHTKSMGWEHSILPTVLPTTASAFAGAINSVAGGGTLLTFPALVQTGMATRIANATSTVALWPGQLSSLWGYRKEIGQTRSAIVPLTIIGLLGGIVGALLLLITPSATFDKIVPFLVLAATCLFIAQEPLSRWQKARIARQSPSPTTKTSSDSASSTPTSSSETPVPGNGTAEDVLEISQFPKLNIPVALLAFGIAVYGGYFGAGIGILTLAALGFLGFSNIHQMNGVKNIFTLFINGVAAIIFVAKNLVDWRICLVMAVGAIFGGYAGAGIARRIGQKNVRRVVIGIGILLTLSLLIKAFHP